LDRLRYKKQDIKKQDIFFNASLRGRMVKKSGLVSTNLDFYRHTTMQGCIKYVAAFETVSKSSQISLFRKFREDH
jgi:hypothetical protein